MFLEHPSSEIYEIDGISFDDIKVEFRLGDRHRTVRLRHMDKLSVVEDIPNSIYSNGRFDEKTLIKHMIETACAYQKKMIVSTVCEV